MAKQKKKRNKPYSGGDAANTRPAVTRVVAINRSKTGQWWHDHKRMVRISAIVALILFVVLLVVIGIIGLLF